MHCLNKNKRMLLKLCSEISHSSFRTGIPLCFKGLRYSSWWCLAETKTKGLKLNLINSNYFSIYSICEVLFQASSLSLFIYERYNKHLRTIIPSLISTLCRTRKYIFHKKTVWGKIIACHYKIHFVYFVFYCLIIPI
jgi:hypothetical protein